MQDKQHKKDNKKPDKDPFIKYYILWPIQSLGEELFSAIKWVWRKLSGAWWCDHCETYHGRRVHRFLLKPNEVQETLKKWGYYEDKYVCSLWKDTHKWHMESSPYDDLQDTKAKIETDNIKQAGSVLSNIAKQAAQAAQDINKDLAN